MQFYFCFNFSRWTVTRRVKDISEFIENMLKENLAESVAVSFALDESVDLSDTEQMAVWVRYVGKDLVLREELLGMAGIKGQTRGQDIYKAFRGVLDRFSVANEKIVSVTTDGAPNMKSENIGFVGQVKKNISSKIIAFHCIIHQESLCASTSCMLPDTMKSVVKMVNRILARELDHRLFKVP